MDFRSNETESFLTLSLLVGFALAAVNLARTHGMSTLKFDPTYFAMPTYFTAEAYMMNKNIQLQNTISNTA